MSRLLTAGVTGLSKRRFEPSQIKDDEGNFLLSQQLLTELKPTLDGLILDESKNTGDPRPQEIGRAFLLNGTDGHLVTNIPSNVSGLAGEFTFFAHVNPATITASGSFAQHRIYNFTN